jgi:hypothetical protein
VTATGGGPFEGEEASATVRGKADVTAIGGGPFEGEGASVAARTERTRRPPVGERTRRGEVASVLVIH